MLNGHRGTRVNLLKCKTCFVTPLRKTFQWFPSHLEMNVKSLRWFWKPCVVWLNSHSNLSYLLLLYNSLVLPQTHSPPPVSHSHQACVCLRTFALPNSSPLIVLPLCICMAYSPTSLRSWFKCFPLLPWPPYMKLQYRASLPNTFRFHLLHLGNEFCCPILGPGLSLQNSLERNASLKTQKQCVGDSSSSCLWSSNFDSWNNKPTWC